MIFASEFLFVTLVLITCLRYTYSESRVKISRKLKLFTWGIFSGHILVLSVLT